MSRIPYKYLVGVVFVFGLFMDLLDMTIVNVALPALATEFDAGTTTIEWVVTAYLLSLAAFIPVSGWAGDRFGTKRVFLSALSLFTLASLLCGLAWNIESLIGFRVLQGIGGGMLVPVGTAMLFRAFPPAERAAAAALVTVPAAVAPATGPVLGGYLVEFHSWPWIFLINVPIGLTGLIVAALVLREEKQERPGRFDVPGFALSAVALASITYALAEAGSRGFGDTRVLAFGVFGLAALATFVAVELRTDGPMIDVRLLLRNRLFSVSNAAQVVGFAGMMGGLFLLPLFLQAEKGLSPFESGLTTFPQAIGVFLMVQPAGRLYKRVGPRRMMIAGMTGIALTTLAFVRVDLETSQWWVRLIMFGRGCSFAFALIPLQTATFATIRPEDTGRASAVFSVGRQVGASLGVALLATALTTRLADRGARLGDPLTRDGAIVAFHDAFIVAAALAMVAAFVSLLISDRDAAPSMLATSDEAAVAEPAVAAGAH